MNKFLYLYDTVRPALSGGISTALLFEFKSVQNFLSNTK